MSYDAVYNLVTNAEYIQPEDLYHYTKVCSLLVLVLSCKILTI